MKTGITGLPYSGKTTLFCALTGQDYVSLPHGKDMHLGTVPVPDARLDRLYGMFLPKKKTPAVMEFFDIAGQGSAGGKGLDPQLVQAFKSADSLVVVLDAFTEGSDPRADFASVLGEFALTDLIIVTGRLERLAKELRAGKSDVLVREQSILETCRDTLENGGRLVDLDLPEQERKVLRGFQLLTLKPMLIVVNITEQALSEGRAPEYERMFGDVSGADCAALCCEVESEIAALDETDRGEFLASMGIEETALGRLVRMSYENLGLISFFTAGGKDEVRAWTARKGATAPECAGVIHSDLQRGFIRAETVAYDDLVRTGSFKNARDQGFLRIEGKDYVVQDGDVLTIRFNV